MKNSSGMKGVSLIEIIMAVSVLAIAVAMAVPSYDQVRQKRQVTGSAEQLASFLSDLQSSVIKRNDTLTVRLVHGGVNDWCVGAVVGDDACDCTVTDPGDTSYCSVEGAPKVLLDEDFPLAGMPVHSSDTAFTYEPVRGLMSSADLGTEHFFRFLSKNGKYGLQVSVLPTGFVRVCNFDSNLRIPGYFDCA